MERKVFVLTSTGERGPFTVDDLKRELQGGAVQRSDQLRTAFGKTVGTVGEMVGPLASGRSSGRMAAATANDSGALRLRHPTKSPRQTSATNLRPIASSIPTARTQGKSGISWQVPVAIIVGLLVLGGVFYAGKATSSPSASPTPLKSSPAPVQSTLPATAPTIRVDVIHNTAMPGKPGMVRISSDRPLSTTLTLRGSTSGFQAPNLIMAAGTSILDIPVVLSERKSRSKEKVITEGLVNLQPGEGYVLGTAIRGSVRLRGSPEPLVAFDDFTGFSYGWHEGWGERTLEAAPGFGVKAAADTSKRVLSDRISSGEVWVSYVFRADEKVSKVTGLSLYDGGTEFLFIGRAYTRDGMSIESAIDRSRVLVQADHQFINRTRVVVNLRISANETVVKWWLLTTSPIDQSLPLGTMAMPTMAFDTVRVFANQPWYLGDLRIGKSWDEVVPLP